MKINLKFNIGDKVWFYLKDENQYAWGKIESIDISVRDKVFFEYHIKNRFYEDPYKERYAYLLPENNRWYHSELLSFFDDDVAASVEELKTGIRKKFWDKMEQMTELKKGWFK